MIAPGINLSLEALHVAAAKLPRIAVKQPERVIGKATVPAMQSGVFWGYIGLIESIVRRVAEEYGAEMVVSGTPCASPLGSRTRRPTPCAIPWRVSSSKRASIRRPSPPYSATGARSSSSTPMPTC